MAGAVAPTTSIQWEPGTVGFRIDDNAPESGTGVPTSEMAPFLMSYKRQSIHS